MSSSAMHMVFPFCLVVVGVISVRHLTDGKHLEDSFEPPCPSSSRNTDALRGTAKRATLVLKLVGVVFI